MVSIRQICHNPFLAEWQRKSLPSLKWRDPANYRGVVAGGKAGVNFKLTLVRIMQKLEDLPGYNDPDSRGFLEEITPWMINGQPTALSADQVLLVYLCLARFHDLEDFGFRRDWKLIESYCPLPN